jgi:Tfp pilus tip-associated adhesin PilY1
MTNYANWHAYYRTRMQAMKTAASRSFEPIKNVYRIGYLSINNNTETDFQNVADFGGENKYDWYKKLFDATPYRNDGETADTPLRQALSQAGWLFAGKYNNQQLNGVDVIDPMQFYCQQNVTILSTDGYWNKDTGMQAGFTLDNTGTRVEDQDGPDSGEVRPMLDGGLGLRYERTEQWKKQITPEAATWNQMKVEQWKVDEQGFNVETKTQDQKETGTLLSKKNEYTHTTQGRLQSDYRKFYWNQDHSTVTEYTRTITRIKKVTKVLYKEIYQLKKSTNTKVTYKDGTLKTKPKTWWEKAERDLYVNIKQVTKSVSSVSGWSTPELLPVGQSCVETPGVRCTYDSGNTTWVKATGACTPGGSGKTEPTDMSGDNTFASYETVVACQYRYSPTEVDVPASAKTTGTTCNEQLGGSGPTYNELHEIKCVNKNASVPWNLSATSCDPVNETCDYDWSSAKDWTGGSACVSTSLAAWPATAIQCTYNGATTPEDTGICTSGTVGSTTTTCTEPRISQTAVDVCPAAGEVTDVRDANGKTIKCVWTTPSTTNNSTSCTPSTLGKNWTSCEWMPTSTTATVSSCTASGGVNGSGVWTQKTECTATKWNTTACVPGPLTTCNHVTEAWSAAYPVTSCTPNRHTPDQVGDTQCSYGPVTTVTNYTPCTSTENDPSPPATYDPSGPSVYKQCSSNWQTSWSPVTTCTNNGVSEMCDYTWTTTVPYDAGVCQGEAVAPSDGPGVWNVAHPVRCTKGYESAGWLPTCPGGEARCTAALNPDHTITDPNFDPEVTTDDATHHYYLDTVAVEPLHTLGPGGEMITTIPRATEAEPSPSNPEFCTPGVTYGRYPDNSPDKRKVITCVATIPLPSEVFPTLACPGSAIRSQNTEGVFNDPAYHTQIMCKLEHPNQPSDGINPDCGRQPDGTLLNDIPAVAPDFIHTICTAGHGDPSFNTLADVAEYYWTHDLRDKDLYNNCAGGPTAPGVSGSDVCANETLDPPRQYMSTYTLGLGASGVMRYEESYKNWETDNLSSGDFHSVWKGVTADPERGICSWQTAGTECNWPRPAVNSQTNIDDLWHAAVNGRGTYFSAQNPEAVATGISAALSDVIAKSGALAAVTVTNPNLTAGSSSAAFGVSFSSGSWTGDITKYKLTTDVNGVVTQTALWSAKSKLDAHVLNHGHANRKIYTFDKMKTDNLKPFLYSELGTDDQKYFELDYIFAGGLSQVCLTGTGTICISNREGAQKEALVNFLRGDRTNEGGTSELTKYFRQRTNLLGDIVNSEVVYVKQAPWNYADQGYADFKASTASRKEMIYVGANDGMLHAFDATDGLPDSGQEKWAYVPKFILPTMFLLADKNYAGKHEYYVDATPVTGDICVNSCNSASAEWKTILVGGANLGGKGYYALDITDPESPKALWEFTDADKLGYTYGNPIITKLLDGTWVVIFASGYNNDDKGGHLFVLNAESGVQKFIIDTGEGSSANPAGLAKITGWVNFPSYNNTVLRVYGGDLLGNLWRFDVNDTIPGTGVEAARLATLKDGDGNAQPITARPELGLIKNRPVVFVGTGQLLGTSDLTTTSTQTIYAIKDQLLADSDYGNPRNSSSLDFVEQKLVLDADGDGAPDVCAPGMAYCPEGLPMISFERDSAGVPIKNPVDWTTQGGWFVDFPVGGERVNTDIRLVQGTLAVVTNTPHTGACVPAGSSNLYFFDYKTGGFVDGLDDGLAGHGLGDQLSTSPEIVYGPNGEILGGIQGDNGGPAGWNLIPPNPPGDSVRRISWRELIIE